MILNKYIIILLFFAGYCFSVEQCPICAGNITSVGEVIDDLSKPSKNLCVWNRSICRNAEYEEKSKICSLCWLSYSNTRKLWEISISDLNGFKQKLNVVIANVPLPMHEKITSRIVYSQQFHDGEAKESVSFWCEKDELFNDKIREYVNKNKLHVVITDYESQKNQCYIHVE